MTALRLDRLRVTLELASISVSQAETRLRSALLNPQWGGVELARKILVSRITRLTALLAEVDRVRDEIGGRYD